MNIPPPSFWGPFSLYFTERHSSVHPLFSSPSFYHEESLWVCMQHQSESLYTAGNLTFVEALTSVFPQHFPLRHQRDINLLKTSVWIGRTLRVRSSSCHADCSCETSYNVMVAKEEKTLLTPVIMAKETQTLDLWKHDSRDFQQNFTTFISEKVKILVLTIRCK